jgi:hypothetical protein
MSIVVLLSDETRASNTSSFVQGDKTAHLEKCKQLFIVNNSLILSGKGGVYT